MSFVTIQNNCIVHELTVIDSTSIITLCKSLTSIHTCILKTIDLDSELYIHSEISELGCERSILYAVHVSRENEKVYNCTSFTRDVTHSSSLSIIS